MSHLKSILEWLSYLRTMTRCDGVVIGISGGKDSTVVAMLSKMIWGNNVLGVLMPNGLQSDLDDAMHIVETLKIPHQIVNIKSIYNSLLHAVEHKVNSVQEETELQQNYLRISDKAKTNIPPRLRMTILYSIAQTLGYRVVGTGNLSEAYIGWTTKWGDSAYDFNPIADLTCTEVVELGKELATEFHLEEKYIVKTPCDGLSNKSDEDNFGFTYEELDNYILYRKGTPKVAHKIERLHFKNLHKMRLPHTYKKDGNAF